MSMTKEEAIKHLLHDWIINLGCDFEIKPGRLDGFLDALDVALSALRPVSREQVEKVWRGEWVLHKSDDVFSSYHTCSNCGCKYGESSGVYIFDLKFCPHCGVIMKAEAVDMVMERMEALYESIHNS